METPHFSRKLPLWYQACESIRAEIYNRIRSNDLRLPPESQLAEEHGVSLITVRQALSVLERDGLITRTRRRGTVINPLEAQPRKEMKVLGTLATVFSHDSAAQLDLLEKLLVVTPEELKTTFRDATHLTYMRRLRRDKNGPINYAVNYMLPEFGENITEADMQQMPIPRILRDKFNVNVMRIDYSASAMDASADIASHLQVPPSSATLKLVATVFDQNERVIDVGRIYCPAGRFSFDISIDMS